MAEERLIDDDKDRKYRIRKNENGEDELVLIDPDEVNGEDELPVYSVITDEDDGYTEEEREEKNAERQQNILKKAEELKAAAIEKLNAGDYEAAKYSLSQAAEITEYDGELYYLLLKAHSNNLTDFSDLEKLAEISDGVREYSDDEQKKELNSLSAPLKTKIDELSDKCTKLSEENESGKAERRVAFNKALKRSVITLTCTMVPFVVFCVLAIVFATMIYSDKNGLYIVPTIVFAALAVVALIVNLFTFHYFIEAIRKVRLNENDSSTQVGRDYLSCKEELENLNGIYLSFKNDLS